jgi:hypothetical protein
LLFWNFVIRFEFFWFLSMVIAYICCWARVSFSTINKCAIFPLALLSNFVQMLLRLLGIGILIVLEFMKRKWYMALNFTLHSISVMLCIVYLLYIGLSMKDWLIFPEFGLSEFETVLVFIRCFNTRWWYKLISNCFGLKYSNGNDDKKIM